ncbi:MAG: hypothetical protein WBM87_11600 [Woeseiaceae bacterium]
MPQEPASDVTRKSSIAKKIAYSRAAQKRLAAMETRLFGVNAKIRSAKTAGHIVANKPLDDAQRAVEANLVAVRAALERLRKSGEAAWHDHAREVDTTWENLSLSINRLVAGYSEGKRDHD